MSTNPVEMTARGGEDGRIAAPSPPLVDKPESEADFIARVRELFARAAEHEQEMRAARRDDLLFVRRGGEYQWPEYARRDRNMPGQERPMLTDNRVRQFRTAVINNIKQNTPSAKVRPVDDRADRKVADVLGGLVRHIEQTTGGDIAKDKAVEFAVDTGLGYFGLMTKYVDDDAWEQEISFRAIEDPFRVYFDPESVLPDGSDAKRAWLVTDIPNKEYERLYGDESGDWHEGDGAEGYTWDTDRTRRIAEYFEVQRKPVELLLLDDGQTVWADDYAKLVDAATQTAQMVPQVEKSRKSSRARCMWYKLSSTKILEKTELPTQYVPIIPVYGEEFWLDGKHYVEGLVRQAKAPQQMLNFWLSCVAEQIALQPKAPFMLPEGSEEADPNWETANTENHPYLLYRWKDDQGNIIPAAPSREAPPQIPTGYTEQMGVALEGIKAAVGMSNPAIGAQESANQSGKALRTLQAASMVGTAHFGDNLAKSVSHAGRIILEMAPRIYDTRRVLRIIGDDGTPDHFVHDPKQPQAYAEQRRPDGGIDKIYNLGIGRYDVAVTVGPTYASRREEGFEVITQLAQVAPQIMQVAGDYVARLSDNPFADQIADRIKATIPPQILAVTEQQGGDPPSPELIQAQQQLQQSQQLIQQLDQAIQGLTKDLETAKSDQQAKAIELQLKSRKQALDEEKAHFDMQIKAIELQRVEQQPAAPAELVVSPIEQARLDMDREKMDREFDLRLLAEVKALEAEEIAEERERRAQEEIMAKQQTEERAEHEVLAQIAARLDALEANAPQHDEVQEEDRMARMEQAIANLARVVAGMQTTGIRSVRDKSGRVVGGVLTKADGSEVRVSVQ